MLKLWITIVQISSLLSTISSASTKPHIVVILADDLGWNDVGFHGSNQIPTPNIDALAYNGVILNNHYVSALCTPSRASLLTGKLPIHLGLQHSVLLSLDTRGLPLKEKLLPQYLKEAGYKTHLVGKWHLGFYKEVYTPTFRGFDSHFGYWNGVQDYYSHVCTLGEYRGFDMRRNMSVAWDTKNKYSTDLFTNEAVRLISQHNKNEPMFMYMAHLAVHSGNSDDPYQAPAEEIKKFSHIKDLERRKYAAMVSKLDQSVGEVVEALRTHDMLENSIILFMTDNGAPTHGFYNNRGSNYPLRGIKDSAWEGAVRGVAAIWSPLIKKSKRISDQLMYVTDWLPTFLSASGIKLDQSTTIDGVDFWSALVDNKSSPRSEILINIDDIANYTAIRRGDFKYVNGSVKNGDDWYGESGGLDEFDHHEVKINYNPADVIDSKVGSAIASVIRKIQREHPTKRSKVSGIVQNQFTEPTETLTIQEVEKLRKAAVLRCNVNASEEIPCYPSKAPCLFNIKEDPCEKINLAELKPEILLSMKEAILKYRATAIPASNSAQDYLGNPTNWNGAWVNWQDPNPSST